MTSPITSDPLVHTRTPKFQQSTLKPTDELKDLITKIPLQIIDVIVKTIIGKLEQIPFIGPLLKPFLDPLGAFFDDLLGILGNPTGMGTGSPVLGVLDSIPIFGPLFDVFFSFISPIFGGIFSGNPLDFFFNILNDVFGLLGNPTALGTGSPILPVVGSIPIFGPLLTGIVQAATGLLSGNLTDLTAYFSNLPFIGDIVNALTGSSGVLSDLSSFGADLRDRISNLLSGGLFDSSALTNIANIPAIAQSRITGLIGDIADRLLTGAGSPWQVFLDRLQGIFQGGGVTPDTADSSSIFSAGVSFFEILAQAPFNLTNLDHTQTENTQTKLILGGSFVTPITAVVTAIRDWYDAHF